MSQYTKNFSSGWAQLILNVSEGSTSAANNTGVVSWNSKRWIRFIHLLTLASAFL